MTKPKKKLTIYFYPFDITNKREGGGMNTDATWQIRYNTKIVVG